MNISLTLQQKTSVLVTFVEANIRISIHYHPPQTQKRAIPTTNPISWLSSVGEGPYFLHQ